MSQKIRSFIGMPIPPETKTVIGRLQQKLSPHFPALRWTPLENLHLTLCFLGEQAEESLEKLCDIVLSVGGSSYCFQLTIFGIGAFPSWHHGRILWLDLKEPAPVSQLHQKLSDGLLPLGFPEERVVFRPHLTIGRNRRIGPLPPLPFDLACHPLTNFTVDRLVLYQSNLTPHGAIYTEHCIARLKP